MYSFLYNVTYAWRISSVYGRKILQGRSGPGAPSLRDGHCKWSPIHPRHWAFYVATNSRRWDCISFSSKQQQAVEQPAWRRNHPRAQVSPRALCTLAPPAALSLPTTQAPAVEACVFCGKRDVICGERDNFVWIDTCVCISVVPSWAVSVSLLLIIHISICMYNTMWSETLQCRPFTDNGDGYVTIYMLTFSLKVALSPAFAVLILIRFWCTSQSNSSSTVKRTDNI
jgi:hypothetical protein